MKIMPDIKYRKPYVVLINLMLSFVHNLVAQNPIIRNMYSADPTARVFENRVYLYPSHDILATPGKGRVGWFCMEDYHVFSSENLIDWSDHDIVVSQNTVPWAKPNSYSMWAPDCIYRNGKYYFYFPTSPLDSSYGRGFAIGVAIADKPAGPFVPEPTPIRNVHGVDPNVFIDKDGQAYLYWAQGNIYAAKLKENMLELASEPIVLADLPTKGLKEGPYVFERNGIYYLTYPHVRNKTESLEYATADNPLGPFKVAGVIMDESPAGCWTNHQSIIQFNKQWYLFYHHNDYSPGFDKARSVRADSLWFNADGSIQKVIPTLRGIGITNAAGQIQIDRFSNKTEDGASISFLDTLNRFAGWKAILDKPGAWMQYNAVSFSNTPAQLSIRIASETGATIVFRTKDMEGPVIAKVTIPKGNDWHIVQAPVKGIHPGIANLVVELQGAGKAEVDWVSFK